MGKVDAVEKKTSCLGIENDELVSVGMRKICCAE